VLKHSYDTSNVSSKCDAIEPLCKLLPTLCQRLAGHEHRRESQQPISSKPAHLPSPVWPSARETYVRHAASSKSCGRGRQSAVPTRSSAGGLGGMASWTSGALGGAARWMTSWQRRLQPSTWRAGRIRSITSAKVTAACRMPSARTKSLLCWLSALTAARRCCWQRCGVCHLRWAR